MSDIKIGLFGARDASIGLCQQSWEFFRALKPHCTLVIDLFDLNGKRVYPERFLNCPEAEGLHIDRHKGFPETNYIREWLDKYKPDIVFAIETPYNYDLFTLCKERNITTFLQFNYEFLDYNLDRNLPLPDVLLSPSPWHMDQVQGTINNRCVVKYSPVPVAMDRFTKISKNRRFDKPYVFTHISGYDLHEDRNGTEDFLNCIPLVNSDCKFIVYSQRKLDSNISDSRIELRETNLDNYWELYEEGDVLFYPRRYAGLSLPVQEAMAAGIAVALPEIPPNLNWAHNKMLIPVNGAKIIGTRSATFRSALFDKKILAKTIEKISNYSKEDFHRIIQYQNNNLLTWDNFKYFYLGIFAEYYKGGYRFNKIASPVTINKSVTTKVGYTSEVESPPQKIIKCIVIRTFCHLGKLYIPQQEVDLDEQRAREFESAKYVALL